MSYDLVMWKSKRGDSPTPETVYERLCEGGPVDSLEHLPLDRILESVKDRFPGIEEDIYELDWDGDEESLQVTWSPQHVHFECHAPTEDTLSRLVQIAAEFECVLYDPQSGDLIET